MCFGGGGSKTEYVDAKPLGSDTEPDGRDTRRNEDLIRKSEEKNSPPFASPTLSNSDVSKTLGAGTLVG